jgi:phosphatidylserine/phosphatidylglycerophosphate/cardiolipin synthase-like enzyme
MTSIFHPPLLMKAGMANYIMVSWCLVGLMFLAPVRDGWTATVEVYYGPDDAPLDRLTMLYGGATRYLYVAVYVLTSPRVVEAMVAAKKRGVDVRLITDRQRTEDVKQRTALHTLDLAGIPILVNRHDGLMHLKQVAIDDEVNASGSMNHTTSGNRYNDERLDIMTDHAITLKAREKFLAMWNDHTRYRPWGGR